ncbi:MAG: hypothetical protein HQL11_03995, partial [Candidatus Omnitrophica bacterium]|nr:hypothetical protein [Candidatus Omnitrophota bacterium]
MATPDGGAFWGVGTGFWRTGSHDEEFYSYHNFDGGFYVLYQSPEGDIGLASMPLTAGEDYASAGIWQLTTGWNESLKIDGASIQRRDRLTPEEFVSRIQSENSTGFTVEGNFDGDGYVNGSGNLYPYVFYDETVESRGWGVFNMVVGDYSEFGHGSGEAAGWTGAFGGSDDNDGYISYLLGEISQGAWGEERVSGTISAQQLTTESLWTYGGELYALADGRWDGEGGVYYGQWEGRGAGTLEVSPLTFSGSWGNEPSSIYRDDDGYLSWFGEDRGLIGSTRGEWWSAAFPMVAMGDDTTTGERHEAA